MIARLLRLVAILGLGLVTALAAAFGFVQTGFAKSQLESMLERSLATEGGRAEVSGLSGLLPFAVRLEQLRLADDEGVWLEVDRARLDLAPGSLLAGRIDIREIGAERVALHRVPGTAEAATSSPGLPELPVLPDSLPPVGVERLEVPRLELGPSLLGRAAVLALEGRAVIAADGRRLDAKLTAERTDERSAELSLAAALDLGTRSLDLELAGGERGGLVAAATGLTHAGPAQLRLEGAGPLARWRGVLAASIERVGAVDGRLGLDLEGLPGLDLALAGRLEPGGLPEPLMAALGERPELAIALVPEGPERLRLASLRLATPALSVDGEGLVDLGADQVEARLRGRAEDLSRLAPLAGTMLAGTLGLELDARGTSRAPELALRIQADALRVAGLQTPRLELTVDTNPIEPTAPSGGLAARIGGRADGVSLDGIPLPEGGAVRLDGSLEADRDGMVRIRGLDLALAGIEAHAAGELEPRTLRGAFRLDAGTKTLAGLAPLLGGGPLPQGSLRLGADLRLQGLEALEAELAVEGDELVGVPAGAAELLGTSLRARASLGLRDRRRLGIEALELVGGGATLTGDAALELVEGGIGGTIRLAVPDLAVLVPLAGQPVTGRADVEARLAGTLAAPRIGFEALAVGPALGPRRFDSLRLAGEATGGPQGGELRLDATAKLAAEELRLVGVGRLVGQRLEIERVRLDGAGLAVDASAAADLDRGLATGRLSGRAVDLARLAPLTLQPVRGAVEVEIAATEDAGRQDARLLLTGKGMGGPFGSLAGARVELAGRDLLGRGGLRGEALLDGLVTDQLVVAKAKLGLDGTLAELGFVLEASGEQSGRPLAIDAEGRLAALAEPRRLELGRLKGTLAGQAVELRRPARITLDKGVLDLGTLDLKLGDATARIRASLGGGNVRADGNLERLPLGRLADLGLPALPGTLEAKLELSGAASRPDGRLKLALRGLGRPETPIEIVATARLTGGRELAVDARGSGLGAEPLAAGVRLPLIVDLEVGRLEVVTDATLSGRLRGRVELARVQPLLPLDGQRLAGPIAVDLSLAGTAGAPRLTGGVRLEDGELSDAVTGLRLRAMQATVSASGDRIVLERLAARDRRSGRLSGTGALDLRAGSWELDLRLDKLLALATDLGTATLSGTVRGRDRGGASELVARLETERAELRLPDPPPAVPAAIAVEEIGSGARSVAEPAARPLPEVALDVRIESSQRLFVRGRGLDSEWSGRIRARGTLAEVEVTGRIELRRGFLDLLGSRFALREGLIEFDGARPPLPRLDVKGEARKTDITARVGLRGRAPKFDVVLESEPALPREEVLARVLFGRELSRISPLQGAMLANSLATLQGGGIDALSPVRRAVGLDTLDVGGDVDTGAAVRAGKYVSERVYVEMQRGVTPESGRARVEVDLGNNLRGTSEVRETSQTGFGVEWRYDY